jgi:hypothetical protein
VSHILPSRDAQSDFDLYRAPTARESPQRDECFCHIWILLGLNMVTETPRVAGLNSPAIRGSGFGMRRVPIVYDLYYDVCAGRLWASIDLTGGHSAVTN